LYFENSLLKPDLELLPAAAAVVTKYSRVKERVSVESPMDLEIAWTADGAMVDGGIWPLAGNGRVLVPAGAHTIEPAPAREGLRVTDLNATLRHAAADGHRVIIEYSSDSRAIIRFDRKPARIEIDGDACTEACLTRTSCTMLLPHGVHRVSAE
jgi:hypothetical protein